MALVLKDKLSGKRIESMKQITKPNQPKVTQTYIWLLIDDVTEVTLGVFSSEDNAWNECERLWDEYEICSNPKAIILDGDMLGAHEALYGKR